MQNRYQVKFLLPIILSVLFFVNSSVVAQPLRVVNCLNDYKNSIKENERNTLVNIKKAIPDIKLDLKYNTPNNFTKTKLYKNATITFLRKDVALALQQANNYLKNNGFGIKIFDAYRPYSVTKLMWELVHDERYVANPINGSGHNRGISIDLTITDLKTGSELNMGTGFDNFTDSAHHSFTKNLSSEIIKNRSMLKSTMEKFGFKSLETEWWHYSFVSKEMYDVMDVDFKTLAKKLK